MCNIQDRIHPWKEGYLREIIGINCPKCGGKDMRTTILKDCYNDGKIFYCYSPRCGWIHINDFKEPIYFIGEIDEKYHYTTSKREHSVYISKLNINTNNEIPCGEVTLDDMNKVTMDALNSSGVFIQEPIKYDSLKVHIQKIFNYPLIEVVRTLCEVIKEC